MKKVISILLSVAMVLSFCAIGTFAADNDITVTINGSALTFDQAPIIQNDRVLVPMRAIFEALNSTIEWDDATKTVTATKDDMTVSVTIGKAELIKNGTAIALDVAPVIVNSRTLVPVRAVAEAFSREVGWDGETRTVIINAESAISADDTDELITEEKDPFDSKYFTVAQGGKALSVEGSSKDDGAKIVLTDAAADDAQVWLFTAQGDDYYTVTNKNSLKSFDVPGESKDVGKGITQYTSNGGAHQTIKLIKNNDGSYSFQFKHSSLYFTFNNGVASQEQLANNGTQSFSLTFVSEHVSTKMGLAINPFLVKGGSAVCNMKLQWNPVSGTDSYVIYRSENGGKYTRVDAVKGISYEDYDLNVGSAYKYFVKAVSGNKYLASATSKESSTYTLPENLRTFTNMQQSGFESDNPTSGILVNGVYYRFSFKGRTDGGKGFGQLMMTTSTDGVNFGNEKEVLNIQDILSDPTSEGLTDGRFEGGSNIIYNSKTNQFVFWRHFEKGSGYDLARLGVGYATVGERFKFKSMRPAGNEARDMNYFIDDDGTAYVMAAANGNADMGLYKLTDDWTDIAEVEAIINRGKHREAPFIIKRDGIYYLITSGTAGWYPTKTMYNSAPSLKGPWSEMRQIGNNSNFSSQSNYIQFLASGGENAYLTCYRWRNGWKDVTDKSVYTRSYPISLANGYAFYDFYKEIYYDRARNISIPVESGKNVSQGKSITASSNSDSASAANDGSYQTAWTANKEWPSSLTIDLGAEYALSEIQISWSMAQGSEAYYNYKVEASSDGSNFTTILDRSSGYTDYGFTIDELSGKARFVRVSALDAHLQNTTNNWYSPQIFEVKVFGN